MNKGKIFIGTSGWFYPHWQGVFYPKELSSKHKLRYFSKYFKTTEVNYSFYCLPKPSTYQNWYSQTPEDFLFAVKASRFITHIKRLKGVRKAWKLFLKNALNLKEKLGPILFQFPPNFKEDEKRLERFLELLRCPSSAICRGRASVKLRFAFEFRHESWCDKKIYNLLKKYNAAWVIADSPSFPKSEQITADFVYIRMHGSKVLFSSKYFKKELRSLALKIKKWHKQGKDIFVYFNNDAFAHAIKNTKELSSLINS